MRATMELWTGKHGDLNCHHIIIKQKIPKLYCSPYLQWVTSRTFSTMEWFWKKKRSKRCFFTLWRHCQFCLITCSMRVQWWDVSCSTHSSKVISQGSQKNKYIILRMLIFYDCESLDSPKENRNFSLKIERKRGKEVQKKKRKTETEKGKESIRKEKIKSNTRKFFKVEKRGRKRKKKRDKVEKG